LLDKHLHGAAFISITIITLVQVIPLVYTQTVDAYDNKTVVNPPPELAAINNTLTDNNVTIAAGSSSPKNEKNFVPPVLHTGEGAIVTWTNEDSALHTVVSKAHAAGSSFPEFDSEYIGPNDTFKYTFSTAGTFDYYCVLHPFMKGKVVVQ
jgi:plastocyanin